MLKMISRGAIVLMIALLAIVPVMAQDDEIYEDPNGLFTVPIPTNWTVEQLDNYAVMHDPDDAISVYMLTVEADTIQDGVDAAWALINPDFDLEPLQTQEIPGPEGVESASVITYDTDLSVRV